MLLLEANRRERLPQVPMVDASHAVTAPDSTPHSVDMAEHFFPSETHRMGVTANAAALVTMLVLLVGAVYAILRLRDVY